MKITQSVKWFIQGDSSNAKRARRIAKITLVVVLFAGLFWIVPFADVVQALLNVDPILLVLGLIIVFLVAFLDAVKQNLLARKLGIRLSILQLLAINLTVKFYLLFMPGALVGGGLRWYKMAQEDGKSAETLVVVTFNRLVELLFAVILGLVFLLLSGQTAIRMDGWWFVSLILFIIALWIGLTRLSEPLSARIDHLAERIQKPFWRGIFRRVQKVLIAVAGYAEFSLWEILLILIVGLVRHMVGITSYVLLARSMGIALSVLDLGWIRSVIVLASTLPISFAGGLGVREVSLIALFSLFGIGADQALAFSLLIFSRGLLLSLTGGVIEAVQSAQPKPITQVKKDI